MAKFSLNGDSLVDETSDPLFKRILQERRLLQEGIGFIIRCLI